MEANEETPGGNEDGGGNGNSDDHEMGTGTGAETATKMGTGSGKAEGGREAKKLKKPHKSCRRHVGNGRDLCAESKTRRQERVGSVAANPDNVESNKEAGRGKDEVPMAYVRTIQVERVYPLCRV